MADTGVQVKDLLSEDGPEVVRRPTPHSYWGWALTPPPRDDPPVEDVDARP